MELDRVKTQIDLRVLVEQDLGKPKSRSHKYTMYKCPFHRESKGVSLAVYQDGWKCFGACNTGGDVFSYLEKRFGYSIPDSLRFLGFDEHGFKPRRRARRPTLPQTYNAPTDEALPPSTEWQGYARELVRIAQEQLWGEAGGRAREYLAKRGFREWVLREAQIGYLWSDNLNDYQYGQVIWDEWELDGKTVRAHMGIVIPHFADGELWAVRVRRPPGLEGPKYVGVRGGTKSLYWSDHIEPRLPIILVEGEFDCLILHQVAGPGADVEVCPVALGSASNKQLSPRWMAKLMSAPTILSRMDSDAAGGAANEVLQSLSGGLVKPVAVPEVKDVNDLYLARGSEGVQSWLREVLA